MTTTPKRSTKYAGVRYYEHTTRKLRSGGMDRYFSIRYKIGAKVYEEGLGWSSEGWNAERANLIRSQLKQARLTGQGPKTLSEMKALNHVVEEVEAAAEEADNLASLTLGQFFKDYYMPQAKKEKRSWATDEQRFAKLINPAFGHMPLAAIKKADIQKFVDDLAESGAAPSTVKQYMAIIRRAFNIAADTAIGETSLFNGKNPAIGVRLPVIRNSRERFLTGEEVEALIAAAAKLPRSDLHDAIILPLNTGLRLGELRRLNWLDVDFFSGVITVREEAMRKPGGKVPINAAAKKVLNTRKSSGDYSQTDLVFPPVYGVGLRENLSHDFRRLVDRLGFNKGLNINDRQRRIVFHSLRHTFASWMALAGVDIYRIKTLMRHKTLDMTMRYAHLIPDATHEAVHNLRPPMKG